MHVEVILDKKGATILLTGLTEGQSAGHAEEIIRVPEAALGLSVGQEETVP